MHGVCRRCGTFHDRDAPTCNTCGYHQLEGVNDSDLESGFLGTILPKSVIAADDRVRGTTPRSDDVSRPRAAVGGRGTRSAEAERDVETRGGVWSRVRAWLRV
jgi:hypothetical protein